MDWFRHDRHCLTKSSAHPSLRQEWQSYNRTAAPAGKRRHRNLPPFQFRFQAAAVASFSERAGGMTIFGDDDLGSDDWRLMGWPQKGTRVTKGGGWVWSGLDRLLSNDFWTG